jgi:hypothetical protein
MMILIQKDKITFVCSHKKADIIETLKQGEKQFPIEVVRRGKNIDENVPLYQSIIQDLAKVSSQKTKKKREVKPNDIRNAWVLLSRISLLERM